MQPPNITIHLLKSTKHQPKVTMNLPSYFMPTVSHYAHTIIKQKLLCTYQKLLWQKWSNIPSLEFWADSKYYFKI